MQRNLSFPWLSQFWRVLFGLAAVAISHPLAQAQEPKQVNPAYLNPVDVPDLPRVLLLGDSISIGYTVAVREQLAGVANVHRPTENCSSTRTGVERIGKWLGDKPWDVIHFNFGLHDQKFVVGESSTLVDVQTPGSLHQVSLAEYEANLEKIVKQLKQSGARLVWCTTTPVPEGATGRIPSDTPKYNEVALRVMRRQAVPVNDLYAYALPQLADIQRTRDVHYSPEGSQVLARQVVSAIREQLDRGK